MMNYSICGIGVRMFWDDPDRMQNPLYLPFKSGSDEKAAITVRFSTSASLLDLPGNYLKINTTNIFFDAVQQDYLLWDESLRQGYKCTSWMRANSDWSEIDIYSADNCLTLSDESNYLVTAFSSRVTYFNGIHMHGSIVEHDGRAVVFTASSGGGKSTHSELWRTYFGDRIINGDKAFLRIMDNSINACGSPWSGSSPYITNLKAPLAAIVVIEKAPLNEIRILNIPEAIEYFATHCYYPVWSAALTSLYMVTLGEVLKHTPVYLLKCKPEPEAAELARQTIFKA